MQSPITLIPLRAEDLQTFYQVCQDIDLRKYLMEGMEMTIEDCHELILANTKFLVNNPVGLYLIKIDSETIGYGGFKDTHPVNDKIDFMYAIIGKYFGRGIGTQVVSSLLKKHNDSRSEKKVTAVVNPENTASIKILEKCKFTFKGFAAGDLSHLHLYEL